MTDIILLWASWVKDRMFSWWSLYVSDWLGHFSDSHWLLWSSGSDDYVFRKYKHIESDNFIFYLTDHHRPSHSDICRMVTCWILVTAMKDIVIEAMKFSNTFAIYSSWDYDHGVWLAQGNWNFCSGKVSSSKDFINYEKCPVDIYTEFFCICHK